MNLRIKKMNSIKKVFTMAAVCVTAGVFTASAQQAKVPPPPPPPPQPPQQKENKVYSEVETQPAFPGGIPGFGEYLSKAIKYPEVDRKNKLTGKVFVTFVVERDGSVTDVVAVRGPSETLKAEAKRVMQASPKWKPGIQNGKPVRVKYTVPINFTLDKEVKI